MKESTTIEPIPENDEVKYFPKISLTFDSSGSTNQSYLKVVETIFEKVVPQDFFSNPLFRTNQKEKKREMFHSLLPIFKSKGLESESQTVSFYLLSKYRPNAFKFFFDMISYWLVPGQRLNVLSFYAVDFKILEFGDDIYTVVDTMIQIRNEMERKTIIRNLPIIESELRLGVISGFYARRILEIKGLAADEKTAFIQEHMAYLVKRLPKYFNFDVFSEMQHVLVICNDEFKSIRTARHLSRITSIYYLFRSSIRKALSRSPTKRHIRVKIFRTKLRLTSSSKQVLGIIIGLNFFGDKEVLEDRHVIKAVKKYVPTARLVEGSYFSNKRGSENICTLYLELEKDDEQEFSSSEILLLRNKLKNDLRDRVEQLMQPLFMPRNEEEIMRNILSLANQIKFVKDLPQVMIIFDEQTSTDLFFTVILVRALKKGSKPIEELFQKNPSFLGYIPETKKKVGVLRKKYQKEANVFRIKLSKDQFLRGDHSIDLFKARQSLVSELLRIIGDFRDFNGGMISKQNELLCSVRDLLVDKGRYDDFLLQNFFYSLNPAIMRNVLEPDAVKTLFNMLCHSLESGFVKGKDHSLKLQMDQQYVYVMITISDSSLLKLLKKKIEPLNLSEGELAHVNLQVNEFSCFGYIYRSDDPQRQLSFTSAIESALQQWDKTKK